MNLALTEAPALLSNFSAHLRALGVLQDIVSSGGQTVGLSIIKDVNGVLKPVSPLRKFLLQSSHCL
jgi:hypothetical protein